VAGVVNLLTRTNIDRPEINVTARMPLEQGGEVYSVSGAAGWKFGNNTNIVAAAEYYLHDEMTIGDRDFFRCPQDLVYAGGPEGGRIDRQDRSIIADTPLGGCSSGNLYANTAIDYWY